MTESPNNIPATHTATGFNREDDSNAGYGVVHSLGALTSNLIDLSEFDRREVRFLVRDGAEHEIITALIQHWERKQVCPHRIARPTRLSKQRRRRQRNARYSVWASR